MNAIRNFKYLAVLFLFSLVSCSEAFDSNDYTAYFGGKIVNPNNRFILFCKDSKVLDTIFLNPDNTFFKKFDSLTPGIYSFKHEPEYQYIYFDKNDSLMVRINSQEFDESIVFCGRGDQKNNFLMELFLKNEHDQSVMLNAYDKNVTDFNKTIDSAYNSKKAFYKQKKESIKWNESFDNYALAMLDFFHYSKKELYPVVHKMRSGEDIKHKLPSDFYNFRENIDFNDVDFTNFSPFVRYLSNMMNNLSDKKEWDSHSEIDKAFLTHSRKMEIADSIFSNESIKNTVLENLAFNYLLEDQNIINNKKFLDKYHSLSTDIDQHNEIKKMGDAIQLLKPNNPLPSAFVIGLENDKAPLNSLINKKTVLFFWTKNLESHFIGSHKRVLDLQKKYSNYDFISICVDANHEKWKSILKNYNFGNVREYRAADFDVAKEKWVLNKIHRTIILNSDGTINNAFVSLFDADFEKNLK